MRTSFQRIDGDFNGLQTTGDDTMQIFHQLRGVLFCGALLAVTCWAHSPQTVVSQDQGDTSRDIDAILPLPGPIVASTVPSNGDVNPYGVVFVGADFPSGGKAHNGDVLVSNFNNSKNLQGTGTTIVDINRSGKTSLFFQGHGIGLSTALGLLRAGFVVVGNFPSTDGTCSTATPGSLLILDRSGNLVSNFRNSKIDGPWDLAIHDEGNQAQLFVANALPGKPFSGSVIRFDFKVGPGGLQLESATQIASGYMNRCDPVAFVVGPTGLVYDATKDVLYVASTEDNAVYAIYDAKTTTHDEGTGSLIYRDEKHLHGPLGMAMAPNGHLVVANSDVINADPNQPSELVEFTIGGRFVAQFSVDAAVGGSFGLAFSKAHDDQVRFAAVDDNVPNITIWNLRLP
jgi:hypothetical protein